MQRDDSGIIVAECPAIPGCVSQGKTEEEALSNIREAVVGCLEVRAEEGLPLTVRTVEIEGLDLQADGGTHVANTSEVGTVRVVDYKSKGRINKRIYLELEA